MKQRNYSIAGLVSVAAAAVGLVFYFVTTMTGYLAGSAPNFLVIACSAAAILLLAALAFGRLRGGARDVTILAAGFLLIAGMILFALDRTSLAADLYFIPVNYPASEQTAFNLSVVGIAGYLAAIVADMAAAFSPDKD